MVADNVECGKYMEVLETDANGCVGMREWSALFARLQKLIGVESTAVFIEGLEDAEQWSLAESLNRSRSRVDQAQQSLDAFGTAKSAADVKAEYLDSLTQKLVSDAEAVKARLEAQLRGSGESHSLLPWAVEDAKAKMAHQVEATYGELMALRQASQKLTVDRFTAMFNRLNASGKMNKQVPWCTVVYSGVPWCTLMYSGVQWCTVVYHGAQWCIVRGVLCCAVQWCAVMHSARCGA